MNRFLLSGFFLLLSLTGPAQNFIGRKAEEIKTYMLTKQNDYSLDETTVNKSYRYLKYEDRMGTRTAYYFLSDDDICTWYRVIYENDMLSAVLAGLDKSYRKLADMLWIEENDTCTYRKILKKQDWFFSVTTKLTDRESLNLKK